MLAVASACSLFAATALAGDVRGTLAVPTDFPTMTAPPAEADAARLRYWEEWNGFLEPRPARVEAAREFAVVLTGAGSPSTGEQPALRLHNGALFPSTVVVRVGVATPLRNDDACAYEIFAQALAPFASAVFGGGEGQPGAFVAECKVTAASGKTAAAQGMQLRLALQRPDHLRADLAYNGQVLTACRAGKELWAAPAGAMKTLAQAAGINTANSAPDTKSAPLIPLALDAKMLAFLPVVFDVKDQGSEDIKGVPHRILQFGLLPELRKAIKAEPFDARAWIGDDFRPRRVIVSGEDYSIQVDVERLTFAPQFPDKAWQPTEGQHVLRLPASALNELFEQMLAKKIELPVPAATP